MSKYIPQIGNVITLSSSKSCGDRSYTHDKWVVTNKNAVYLFLKCIEDRGVLSNDVVVEISDHDFDFVSQGDNSLAIEELRAWFNKLLERLQ